MWEIILAVTLTVVALTSWGATLVGMPGNWVIVAIAALLFWFRPEEYGTNIGLGSLVTIVLAAAIGELLEFVASALGASRKGGSKRGAALALGGSIVGAIAGLIWGNLIPIPLIGPLIASLLLGATGAFGGALAGERWAGKDWNASIEISNAAFWGRLLGTVAKAVCGTIATTVFAFAIWL